MGIGIALLKKYLFRARRLLFHKEIIQIDYFK